MSENRIRIQKQLEKSIAPNSIIITDTNNEPRYEPYVDNALPSPQWRKGTKQSQLLWDGSGTVECDSFYVKVPRVKQSLIDDGVLFVQFGRLDGRKYTNNPTPKVRMKGIKWYSPCDASNAPIYPSGSGEIGGRHNGNAMARPNLIPVTAQNQTITQALPIWAFYGTKDTLVFNGDISNSNGVSVVNGVPYLTGSGKRAGKGMYSPDFYHRTGGLSKKRPKRPMWRSNDHARSVWYARLVVIRDGRVVSYGSVSEAVIFRPNQLTFSTETMSSTIIRNNGSYGDSGWAFVGLYGDIQSNYRD